MPAELAREPSAALLVEVRDDLGVAPAAEAMAAPLEPRADVEVVVQLAVLHRPDAAGLVGERLVTALDVDDR